MDPAVKLPRELEEDILSRLPLESIARFKTVCKQWNSLFNDKSFLNYYSRPQFIFLTNSKVYSIDIIDLYSIDPKIQEPELPFSGIPCRDLKDVSNTTITTCDELLFCNSRFCENGTAVWNPWLRQLKWIEYKFKNFYAWGLGYNNSRPEKVYKILGYFLRFRGDQGSLRRVATYECASHALKYIDTDWPITEDIQTHVSLNGNLYWVTNNPKTNHEYFIRSFDFSREIFEPFCILPCQKNHSSDSLVLAVFKGDRFSLLKQCYVTRKIEIWVTEKKIDREEEVVWIKLMMTLPTTKLPNLFQKYYRTGISYFIYDKAVIICCGDDETGAACIYIVRGDLCKKIKKKSTFFQCCHCVYGPNWISLPLEFR